MRTPPPLPGCLVVVELGAEWPERAILENGLCPRRVVTELESENPAAFAARFASVSGRLFPPGVRLSSVVVACNERTDPAATAARRAIAGSALRRKELRGVRVVYCAGERASGRLRHALSALATDLALATSTKVTVRFGSEIGEVADPTVARVA